MTPGRRWWALCFWLAAGLAASSAAWAQAKKAASKKTESSGPAAKSDKDIEIEKALLKATARMQTAYLKELSGIVTWAATNGLADEASALLKKMEGIDREYPDLGKLKASVQRGAASSKGKEGDAEERKKAFAKKIETANDNNGKRLFDLAASCMKLGLFSRAYDLVNAVIEADPDHKKARDILSFSWDSTSKTWITKWEANMRKTHFLTDEGWVKTENKKKWESGQREYQGKWVSKEEEERIRKRNSYNPFSVESEHFDVQTNLGRKQAYEFAMLLEDFYRQFSRFYIGFYDQVAGAKLLFNAAKVKKKHQVLLFPSHEDYLTFVKQEMGNDELLRRSGGFYASSQNRSYFFWVPSRERVLNVLYHEVTHQLLEETKGGAGGHGDKVWAVEGIATYMETWEKVSGKWMPGHKVGIEEMQLAKSFMATGQFDLMGYIATDHKQFHEPANRGLNYSLGGALCHFLLHYGDEIYKEGFIRFLSDYYGGKASGDALLKYLPVEGVKSDSAKASTIQKQFKEHMEKMEGGGAKAAEEEETAEGDSDSGGDSEEEEDN